MDKFEYMYVVYGMDQDNGMPLVEGYFKDKHEAERCAWKMNQLDTDKYMGLPDSKNSLENAKKSGVPENLYNCLWRFASDHFGETYRVMNINEDPYAEVVCQYIKDGNKFNSYDQWYISFCEKNKDIMGFIF